MNRYRQGGLSGEYLVVAVSSPEPFQLARAGGLRTRRCDRLEELPELEAGITPFNLVSFEKKSTRLVPVPVAPGAGPRAPPRSWSIFRRRLTATPYAANLVVSRDLTVLAAFFPRRAHQGFRLAHARRCRKITAPLDRHYRCYLSGSIPFVERTGVYLSRDLAVLFGGWGGAHPPVLLPGLPHACGGSSCPSWSCWWARCGAWA